MTKEQNGLLAFLLLHDWRFPTRCASRRAMRSDRASLPLCHQPIVDAIDQRLPNAPMANAI